MLAVDRIPISDEDVDRQPASAVIDAACDVLHRRKIGFACQHCIELRTDGAPILLDLCQGGSRRCHRHTDFRTAASAVQLSANDTTRMNSLTPSPGRSNGGIPATWRLSVGAAR